MESHKTSLMAALSLAALAGGCSGGGGSDLSLYTKIDDMESVAGAVAWASPTGPSPVRWSTTTDCTEADRLLPPPDDVTPDGWSYAELPAPSATFPGITSAHAARMRTTTPLTGVWGAEMVVGLAAASGFTPPDAGAPAGQTCRQSSGLDYPGSAVDLSGYRAITFWAMATTPDAKMLRVNVQDRNSDPRGGLCNAGTPGSEKDCYNDFGSVVTLSDTFRQYTLEFASMAQDGVWGFQPNPPVVDLAHVYVFTFEILTPEDCGLVVCAGGKDNPLSFDIWVDDVYLVRR